MRELIFQKKTMRWLVDKRQDAGKFGKSFSVEVEIIGDKFGSINNYLYLCAQENSDDMEQQNLLSETFYYSEGGVKYTVLSQS